MTALEQLLGALRGIGSLEFTARSAVPTGWNGSGMGRVDVATPDPDTVVFTESGHWTPAGSGQSIRFNNVFRWTRCDQGRLGLDHLRFGPDQPVHLFELAAESPTVWASRADHECVDDRYSARLEWRHDVVQVRWSIIGPRKSEDIAYLYRPTR
ncbi:hypothetical protein BH09PSE6_BH09PSE6_11840 [soil metagenome]